VTAENLEERLIIPFALDQQYCHADLPFIYRPWGTRTLKLKITSQIDLPGLWVRPGRVSQRRWR